jgi:hypothetical protein
MVALKSNTTGTNNTAAGDSSLFKNTTGNNNSALGVVSLTNNTTGDENSAFGVSSLANNSSGSKNTATGYQSLYGNTTGNQNTAVGYNVLYTNTTGLNNTGIGVNTLRANTTGNGNAAIGINALYNNTTGQQNLAFGRWALIYNTTGSSNIGLGNNAGGNLTTGSNNIDIGSPGEAGEDATIRLGDSAVQTRTFIAGIRGVQNLASSLPVYIDPNGQLGIAVSSEQYKEDITDMGGASQSILKLRPVTYRYKTPDTAGEKPLEYGLIAEEVAKVYPDLVAYDAEGKIQSVQYQKLTPMLLNEVQRLVDENRKMKASTEAMANQLAKERAKTEGLAKKVSDMESQSARLQAIEARLLKMEHDSSGQRVAMVR